MFLREVNYEQEQRSLLNINKETNINDRSLIQMDSLSMFSEQSAGAESALEGVVLLSAVLDTLTKRVLHHSRRRVLFMLFSAVSA